MGKARERVCRGGQGTGLRELRTFGFFFFSSRRRHTRLQGDWSSDVCSSDLATAKMVNYAVLYGKTPYTLAKDIGVTPQAAQEFIDAYFAGFSRVRAFIDRDRKSVV